MNELTKEELIWLEETMRFDIQNYKQPEIAVKVHRKIQSMLENYCEHEFKKTLAQSGMYFIEMCHKCNKEQS